MWKDRFSAVTPAVGHALRSSPISANGFHAPYPALRLSCPAKAVGSRPAPGSSRLHLSTPSSQSLNCMDPPVS